MSASFYALHMIVLLDVPVTSAQPRQHQGAALLGAGNTGGVPGIGGQTEVTSATMFACADLLSAPVMPVDLCGS